LTEAPVTPLGQRAPVSGGVDVDLPGAGVRLRATRWDGVGTPVMLLHGLASQRRFWDLVVARLPGVPLLAVDQRGHGDSDVPTSGYDGSTVTSDAVAVLDAIGWDSVVVVGHSWGAATALSLAAREPDRVCAVICVDGGFGGRPATVAKEELRALLEPPRFAATPDELRTMLRAGIGDWWSPAVEAAVLPGFGVGADGLARSRFPFAQHMQVVDAMLEADPAAVFGEVRCPAWLVAVEPISVGSDPLRAGWTAAKEAGLAAAADKLAQPRLLRWAGAVHDVPLQWPALVAGLVLSALDEAGEGGAG
jgi:pimeloyl-ACP methyl ester carboxylesterase